MAWATGPYGEDRDAGTSLNTDHKFTGQTEDETPASTGTPPGRMSRRLGASSRRIRCAGSSQPAIAEPLRLRLQQPA